MTDVEHAKLRPRNPHIDRAECNNRCIQTEDHRCPLLLDKIQIHGGNVISNARTEYACYRHQLCRSNNHGNTSVVHLIHVLGGLETNVQGGRLNWSESGRSACEVCLRSQKSLFSNNEPLSSPMFSLLSIKNQTKHRE